MQLKRTIGFRCCKSALAGLLIALVLISSILTVSPALHHALHQDSSQSSHQCIVTLLDKQQVLAGEPQPVLIISNLGLIGFLPQENATRISSVDYTSSPSRAPPASFSSVAIIA